MQNPTTSLRSKANNKLNKESKKLNTTAAISQLKVDALPSSVFYGDADIVPYGVDNYYPWRIVQAIKKSPTAIGCNRRMAEFVYGFGFGQAGEVVVNREGETLNKVLLKFIESGYSRLYGGGLHFNFNVLGQITEIYFIDIEYIRKHRSLKQVDYGLWQPDLHMGMFTEQYITVDLYGEYNPVERMKEQGLQNYRGQVYYFSKNSDIYPTSLFDSVAVSAEYERESQIYPYANIINGFSGTSIIKKPSMGSGADKKGVREMEENINKMAGSRNAGSKLVIEVPIDNDGKMHNANLVEHLTPTSIDGMFKEQDAAAERKILKACMMPPILLGAETTGMFNTASYNDAWNYKISDTEFDRQLIEAEFNKIMARSVWNLPELEIVPPTMKGQTQVNGI